MDGHLFEEFVTSKPDGVGLGLAVARQVVLGHGGRIDWRREQGRTCFRILLPVAPASQDAGDSGAQATADGQPLG